jgi:hypothetical protein
MVRSTAQCVARVRLILPARPQQHCSEQEQATEAKAQATFRQSVGESDPRRDRSRATERQRNTDRPADLAGGGIGEQGDERTSSLLKNLRSGG